MAVKLTINNISFSYGSVKALEGFTIEITEGEAVSLVGPNGAGKSTLIKCIDRILKPHTGAILLDGNNIAQLNTRKLSTEMGYVPQSNVEVFPFTVFDIVLMGRKPYIGWNVSNKDLSVVAQTLEFTGMQSFGERYFDELSGGEKQKAIIARAIAQEPQVLLLDEPTSNLDIKHQLEVMELVTQIIEEKRISVVMAMHDLNLAARFSDRMVMMKDRQVFKIGKPETILNSHSIWQVFNVHAHITTVLGGKPVIIPLTAKHENE